MTPRPWRLTRRQRVEMEAAVTSLRTSARCRWLDPADLHRWMMSIGCGLDAAPGVVAGAEMPYGEVRRLERAWWRLLRARVAIALRAALRADEDARCEGALAAASARYPDEYEYRELREGAEEQCDALREWPALRRATHPTATERFFAGYHLSMDIPARTVPLALWERVTSR